MAYTTEYFAKWIDQTKEKTYRILIQKDGFSGSQTEIIKLNDEPCFVRSIGDKSKLQSVVQGSELIFTFYSTPSDLDKYEPIFESAYKDYKIILQDYTISASPVDLWIGWLKPENLNQQFFRQNYLIELSATDGLADLKNIQLTSITDGKISILETLKSCLTAIELELDFKIQLGIFETNYMTSTDCAIEKVLVDARRFYEVKSGVSVWKDCHSIITEMLKNFHCILKQSEGYWNIINLNEGDSYIFTFDFATLTQQSRTAAANIIDVDAFKYSIDATLQKIAPINSLQVIHRNQDLGGDLLTGLSDWSASGAWTLHLNSEQTIEGSNLEILSVEATSSVYDYYILSNSFAASYINGNEYVSISFNSFQFGGAIIGNLVTITVDLYRNSDDELLGTWIVLEDSFEIYRNHISPKSPAFLIPVGGETYYFKMTFTGDSAPPTDFKLKDVHATSIAGISSEEYSDAVVFDKINFFKNTNINYPNNLEIESLYGDTEEINHIGGFFINDLGTVKNTINWRRYGKTSADDDPILTQYAKNVLNNYQRFKDFLKISVYDPDFDIKLNSILQLNSKYYQIGFYDRNFRSNWIQLDIFELIFSDSAQNAAYNIQLTTIDGVETSVPSVSVSPSIANYFPTAFAWTNGTTSGAIGSLTGTGMNAVSFPAIPTASASISGIVTTGTQTFGGTKTFASLNVGAYAVWHAGNFTNNSTNWNAAYSHSQDNSQAHSDYLINNGNDSTSGTITAAGLNVGAYAVWHAGNFTNNSTNWNTAYSHSQITTGNPHNIDLADIGESLASINYWSKGTYLYYNGSNVGIGTATPYNALHVIGGIYAQSTATTSGVNTIFGQEAGNLLNNFNSYTGLLLKKVGTGGGDYLSVESTTSSIFTIRSNGNVSIGNTNNTYKLDVSGAGRFTNLLTLQAGTQSNDYSSGFIGAGWSINSSNEAEFDNLKVRGTFTINELLINQIRSTNGSLFVSDSMKYEVDEGTDATYYRIGIDTEGDTRIVSFLVNDIFIIQKWDGSNLKKTLGIVDAVFNTVGHSYIRVPKSSIVGDVPVIGDNLIRIGNTTTASRQGAIYLTNSENNAPYIDVYDSFNSTSDSFNTKVRLGNLTGIVDADLGTLSGYGLFSENVYLKGAIVATSGTIGGWSIDSSYLWTGTKQTTDAYSSTGITFASAGAIRGKEFRIDSDGSAHFKGALDAPSGTIGGWSIDTTKISITNIELDSSNSWIKLGSTYFSRLFNYGMLADGADNFNSILNQATTYSYSDAGTATTIHAGGGFTFYKNENYMDTNDVKKVHVGIIQNKDTLNSLPSAGGDSGIQVLRHRSSTNYFDTFRVDKNGVQCTGLILWPNLAETDTDPIIYSAEKIYLQSVQDVEIVSDDLILNANVITRNGKIASVASTTSVDVGTCDVIKWTSTGSNGTITLTNPTEGKIITVINTSVTNFPTITPARTSSYNTVKGYSAAQFIYISPYWYGINESN